MKVIDREGLRALSARAAASPRRRQNLNLHPALADPVQRMLNAFEPGTYVRPHRHAEPGRWELFLALAGSVAVLSFDEAGRVTGRLTLAAGGPTLGVEVPPGTWHGVVALEAGTVLFESKPGPYRALTDKDFAPWAPPEGDPRAAELEAWMRGARVGDVAARRD